MKNGRENPASALSFAASFLLLFVSTVCCSQSIANSNKCFSKPDKLDGQEVFGTVNHQPEYPGGLPQFYKDVLKILKNPDKKFKGSEKFTLTFVVDTAGHVRNFCFIVPDDGRYNNQIDSLVNHIDKWSSGKLYNRKVNVRMLLPMIVEWR